MSGDMAKVWDAWHSMPIPKNRTYDPDLRANCLLKGRLLLNNGKRGKKTAKLKESDRPFLEAAVVWVKIVGGRERVFGWVNQSLEKRCIIGWAMSKISWSSKNTILTRLKTLLSIA